MEGSEFENLGFDPRQFFEQLRKSASVRSGAIMFGQAQVAYYDLLKEHMGEEQAYNMLAHTTEILIRSIASMAGPLAEVAVKAAALANMFDQQSDKEVPGE